MLRHPMRLITSSVGVAALLTAMLCIAPRALADDAAPQAADSAKRPNIIIILADDMGFSDIGAYGSEIDTPNIDRLAQNGIKFRRFYNNARCCPTRASILTGRYPHQAGVGWMVGTDLGTPEYQDYLNQESVTIAEVLKNAGYFTMMTGKWHVAPREHMESWPANRGFDRTFGSLYGGDYYSGYRGTNTLFQNGKILFDRKNDKIRDWPLSDDFYGPDAWTDWAIRYIDEARKTDKPFFLYLAHVTPHFAIQAPDDLVEKYRGRYLEGWNKLRRERFQRQIELGLFDPSTKLTQWPLDVPKWDELSDADKNRMDLLMAIYAAAIERMDYDIGRLVDSLREDGELDNTVIMFLSDNGGNLESGWRGQIQDGNEIKPRTGRKGGPGIFVGQGWATASNTPFRKYKHYIDEGGTRTPFIVQWPDGIDPQLRGQWVNPGPGHIIDVMATCVDLANADYPSTYNGHDIGKMEGLSLAPAFHGEPLNRPVPIFWEHEGNAGVVDMPWKLVKIDGQGWRLYNLAKDPTEMHNLAYEQPQHVEEMAEQWQQWADRVGVVPWEKLRR